MTSNPPPLTVLYRDAEILVVDKPSGLVVHCGWAQDDVVLVDLVRQLCGGRVVHPVGRLDRGTSGAVLFALDPKTARRLSDASIVKSYLALVRGVTPPSGVIEHPIPRRPGGPRVAARSRFWRLSTAAIPPRSVSLVKVEPETGRLHQVRRHLKHISHPVIGDANYGKGPLNREFTARYGLARLALHARELCLPHPSSGEAVWVSAPVPEDLCGPLARMGVGWDLASAAIDRPPAAVAGAEGIR